MSSDNPASEVSARSPRDYCWTPTMNLEPGMVIARPVLGGPGIQVTIHLAVGSVLTANTIAQLVNKGVECVAVVQNVQADLTAYADTVSRYEARLHEIFGSAPDENCRPLLEALLADGPCQC